MHAIDHDSGMNGQLSYSVVYQSDSERVFNVRPKFGNSRIAELYTLRTLDRESSNYGTVTYKGTVSLKVNRIKIIK